MDLVMQYLGSSLRT